jgi:hypothetical protein
VGRRLSSGVPTIHPAVVLGILSLVVASATPSFSNADHTKLEAGGVLVKRLEPTNGEGVSVKAAGVINESPSVVFEILDRCGEYAEFMPRTKKSEERRRTGDRSVCFTEVSLPFPLKNLWAETNVYRAKLDGGALKRMWKLKKGTYHRNTGSWTVYPWKKGRSLAVYFMDVAPDIIIPDAITRAAQSSTVPDLFKAVRKRIRRNKS